MAEKYIAYYGLILLKLNSEVSSKLDKLWQEGEASGRCFYEPYYDEVILFQEKIMEVLKRSSNVSNIKWVGELQKEHFDPFQNYMNEEDDYLMRFSSDLMFDVNLPVNNRTYEMPIRYEKKIAEKFSVIYNGNTFLAYAPIESSIDESHYLGPEIREMLIKVLSGDLWEGVCVPPCPLRMTFYIQSQKESENEESELKIFNMVVDGNPYKEESEIHQLVLGHFYQNEFMVNCYYSIETLNHKLERIVWDIQDAYDEIRKEYTLLSKFKGNKKIKLLREKVFSLYELLYEYDKYKYKYKIEKESFVKIIEEMEVSEYLQYYLLKHMDVDIFPQENIINAVEYIEERLNSDKNNLYVVFGAIIGSTFGVIITLSPMIVKWISSLF